MDTLEKLSLDAEIEALLFFRAEPLSTKKIAVSLSMSENKVEEAVNVLEEKLLQRGVRLMRRDDKVMLGTAPEMSAVIEGLIKAELERDLGKAGLETLTIVLYRGPVTRAEVDYVRGVNSRYILRHLLVRGLVERIPNSEDSRSFLYQPTFDLLGYLGIKKVEDLPEYSTVKSEIKSFEAEHKKEDEQ